MLSYIIRRLIFAIPTLIIISVITFVIIDLPPGDYLTTYVAQLESQGTRTSEATIASLKTQYGLDQPLYTRYFKWIGNIVINGNFGYSFQWQKQVSELIGERLALTITISIFTMFFVYLVAIPIGIYSATHQYSIGDYTATFVGFIGLAIPNFLFALFLLFITWKYHGFSVGGLFSSLQGSTLELG